MVSESYFLQKKFLKQIVASEFLEAVVPRFSVEKVLLEISQNSQENTCARVSFLMKLQALGLRL